MPRFGYVAIGGNGVRMQGAIQATDCHDATRKLIGRGDHPLRVVESDVGTAQDRSLWGRVQAWLFRVRSGDLAILTRQMSSLLNAGLPLLQAIVTLRSQCGSRRLDTVLEDIEMLIRRDAVSLAEAMERHPRVFDPVYRGLVQSGEESGNLVDVLHQLSMTLTRTSRLSGQVLSAFIYPAFLLLMGGGAVFVLMAFIVPKFQDLFTSFGQELPFATRVLIIVSGFMGEWWWAILAGAMASLVFLISLLSIPRFKYFLDKYILRFPIVGDMLLKVEIARLARTISALSNGGVRMIKALRVTERAMRNSVVRETFPGIIKEVAGGHTLADGFQGAEIYPVMMVNLIRTGEETGELPSMLTELASVYEEEAERAIDRAMKLMEPILIVFMGLIIAGIVAAVMLPIIQANTLIG